MHVADRATDQPTERLTGVHDDAWEKTWQVAYHYQLCQVYARHLSLLHYAENTQAPEVGA